MLRIACAFGLGLALGALVGSWIVRDRRAADESQVGALERAVHELETEQARWSVAIAEKLEDVRRRLDEVAASAHTPSSPREMISAATASPDSGTLAIQDPVASSAEISTRILRLESTIAAMTSAIERRGQLAQYPAVEQLRNSRRDVDRAFIARVSETMVRDHEAGLAMVRYLTFADILAKIGPPTTLNVEGNWFYERPEGETLGPASFELDFINGYVVQVHTTDD